MRIKKHPNRNEYAITKDGIWVRNLTKKNSICFDINNLAKNDYDLLLANELENYNKRIPFFEFNEKYVDKVVIVSDGYNFTAQQEILADLPKDVVIIGINKSLANWKLVGEKATKKRTMNYYVVNNPFEDCENFLPKKHKYFPKCIASTRANSNFLEKYRGEKYLYQPMYDACYSTSLSNGESRVDDYRNPICAAVAIAYLLKAQKIALLCCDGSFEKNMAGSIKLENGLYSYPQHITCQQILDTMFYWLSTKNIEISDCSMGIKYKNASYINLNQLNNFLED